MLLDRPVDVIPPRLIEVPIFAGTIAGAKGHLGAFEIDVDGYAPAHPSSRRFLAFERPRDGAASRCDLILDLTGGTPLFPAHQKRDGYFRPDPRDPAAVQQALFDLTDLVGEFEKPRYVTYDAELCAHAPQHGAPAARAASTSARPARSHPAGDHVAIDPYRLRRLRRLRQRLPDRRRDLRLSAARARCSSACARCSRPIAKAGGAAPRRCWCTTAAMASELIALMARLGRGLPARVLPFARQRDRPSSASSSSPRPSPTAPQRIRLLIRPKKRERAGRARGPARPVPKRSWAASATARAASA